VDWDFGQGRTSRSSQVRPPFHRDGRGHIMPELQAVREPSAAPLVYLSAVRANGAAQLAGSARMVRPCCCPAGGNLARARRGVIGCDGSKHVRTAEKPSPGFRCPDTVQAIAARRQSVDQPTSFLAWLGFIREIVRFNLLPAHHPEKMLSMLVIVLRLYCITAQDGCLCKRYIALVLSSSISQNIATSTPELLGRIRVCSKASLRPGLSRVSKTILHGLS